MGSKFFKSGLGKSGLGLVKSGLDLGKSGLELGKSGLDLVKFFKSELGKSGLDLGKSGLDPCWVKYLSERVAVILDSAVFEIRLSPKLDFEGL